MKMVRVLIDYRAEYYTKKKMYISEKLKKKGDICCLYKVDIS